MTAFWKFIKDDQPELRCLADLAIHVLNMCHHSAAIERIWSLMSNIHTKARNRLLLEKVVGSAVLKLDIIRERRIKQSKMKAKPKATTACGLPVAVEPSGKKFDDYLDEGSIEDLFAELEEMEDFDDVDDSVDNSGGDLVLTLRKLFG